MLNVKLNWYRKSIMDPKILLLNSYKQNDRLFYAPQNQLAQPICCQHIHQIFYIQKYIFY